MKAEYNLKKAKRGAIVEPKGKTRISVYLDNDILQHYRKQADKLSKGYQTLINEDLKQLIKDNRINSTAALRRIIREELKRIIKD